MKKIIKNGNIVTAESEFMGDVLIEDGKIAAIGEDLTSNPSMKEGAEIIDAGGKYILPGGVDQHVHFSFQYKGAEVRGFETSHAAALGGTTSVIEFVNQIPGKGIAQSILEYEEAEVKDNAMVDYSFHGVVSESNDALFEEIPHLPESGISTLKLFMAYKGAPYHCDDDTIFKALQASKEAGVTIMVHAENADVIDVLQNSS